MQGGFVGSGSWHTPKIGRWTDILIHSDMMFGQSNQQAVVIFIRCILISGLDMHAPGACNVMT